MPAIVRYPTAPLRPEIDATLPFRSWLRTATDVDLARYNAALHPGEPRALPWDRIEPRFAAREDNVWSEDEILGLLTHPDERAPAAIVDHFGHTGIPSPVLRAARIVLEWRLQRRTREDGSADRAVTPLLDALHDVGEARPFHPELSTTQEEFLARVLPTIHVHEADARLSMRGAAEAIGAVIELDHFRHPVGAALRVAPIPEGVLVSATPLGRLFRAIPQEAFRGASPATIAAMGTWSPDALWLLRFDDTRGEGRVREHTPFAHLSTPSLATLREAILTWMESVINELHAGTRSSHPVGAAALLGLLRKAGAGLTPAELHRLLGHIPLQAVAPGYERGRGIYRGRRNDARPLLHHAIAGLQCAVTGGEEDDLEKLVLATTDTDTLSDLLTWIPMTPRVAEAVLYASNDPSHRSSLAWCPDVRHAPVVQARLLASRSDLVLTPYLRTAPPERYAHFFRIMARSNARTALQITAERWDEIHDYMDPADFSVISDRAREPHGVAQMIALLEQDLQVRTLGSVPAPGLVTEQARRFAR